MQKRNNAISFIPRGKFPKFKTVTYGRIVALIRSHKTETHRVRLTVGGDRLEFDGVTSTQCTVLVTTKMLFNSTVSIPGDRFFKFDIKGFYYGSSMIDCEYMRIQLKATLQEIIDQYD